MNATLILILSLIELPIIFMLAQLPYFPGRSRSFGIVIPASYNDSPELVNLRKNYRRNMLLSGLAVYFMALLWLAHCDGCLSPFILLGATLLPVCLWLIFSHRAHAQVQKLKQLGNWTQGVQQIAVSSSSFQQDLKSAAAIWFLFPVSILCATIYVGLQAYPNMPAVIATHYNMRGSPNHWSIKSFKLLFIGPIIQVGILLVHALIYWCIVAAKQQLEADQPEASLERELKKRRKLSIFTIISCSVSMLIGVLVQLAIVGIIHDASMIVISALLLSSITTIGWLVAFMYNTPVLSRTAKDSEQSKKVMNRDDDAFWRWYGYYNHSDPALIVEKRFGVGWTFNFAHLQARLLLAAIIGGSALIGLLSLWLAL